MTLPFLLLALRVISALLLLLFMVIIAWIAYQDMQYSAEIAAGRNKTVGHLRVVSSGKNEQLVNMIYPLQSVTRIGRAVDSTIVIDDDYVSNEHLLVEWREGWWWLTDLESRNGTLLNAQPLIKPTIISAGDLITVGSMQLVYEQMIIPNDNANN